MYDTKYVFSQLTDYLNYDRFRKIVDKYKANSYVKKFTCWNLLMVMLFGQLSKRVSARTWCQPLKLIAGSPSISVSESM